MKIKNYLIVDNRGNTYLRKTIPALRMSEVSILLEINIPDAVFTRPSLSAKIDITDSDIDRHLSAETQSTVIDAIKEATGFEVNLLIQEAAQNESHC